MDRTMTYLLVLNLVRYRIPRSLLFLSLEAKDRYNISRNSFLPTLQELLLDTRGHVVSEIG